MMDSIDKKLLQVIQYDFPIANRPYQLIGETLDLSEEEVIRRITNLKEEKIIRRVGGIFSSKKIGYKSMLCAIKATPEDADSVAEIINCYQGVTHNYNRNHEYNVWFTLITESEEAKEAIIKEIEDETGYSVN